MTTIVGDSQSCALPSVLASILPPLGSLTLMLSFLCAKRCLISAHAKRQQQFSYTSLLPITSWTLRVGKPLQLCLSAIVGLAWLCLMIRQSVSAHLHTDDHVDLCNFLFAVTMFVVWMTHIFVAIISPAYHAFGSVAYIHAFFCHHLFFVIYSGYQLFQLLGTSTTEVLHLGSTHRISNALPFDLDVAVLVLQFGVCAILLVLFGTMPQPLNPLNLSARNGEKIELKQGWIYFDDHALCPEATASIFSWMSFQWINRLVRQGFAHPLSNTDLYALTFQHLSRLAHRDFTHYNDTTGKTTWFALLKRLCATSRLAIGIQFIASHAAVLLAYLDPFFQLRLLWYLEHPGLDSKRNAYMYVIGMLSAALLRLVCVNIQLWAGRRWNMRTLSVLDAELYAKTVSHKQTANPTMGLTRDGESDTKIASSSFVGKLTNLMSVDADRIAELPAYIHMFYTAPMEMTVAILYLYYLLGTAALVGIGVLILFFPITWLLTRKMRGAYERLSAAQDTRNNLVHEMLRGIRTVKFFAWETSWMAYVMESRKAELRQLIRTIVLDIVMSVGHMAMPVLVSVFSFIWYVKVSNHALTASTAFVSIVLFDMVRKPIMLIPEAITTLTESYVSLKRIAAFLDAPDVGEHRGSERRSTRVGFDASVFEWPTDTMHQDSVTTDRVPKQPFRLCTPAFDFPVGQLSIVCGPTASGKTSLLCALLDEMDTLSGNAYCPLATPPRRFAADYRGTPEDEARDGLCFTHPLSTVAYASQTPVLMQGSIRDNILFGQAYDAFRYKKAIHQCALDKDLAAFTDGDKTEIGERGISLSGGQKQRVALARAIYSHARTVLLDDCLSAVDAQTARYILEHCLTGDLLEGRTVILVTHHVQLVSPAAQFLVRLEHGRVVTMGPIHLLQTTKEWETILSAGGGDGSDTTTTTITSDTHGSETLANCTALPEQTTQYDCQGNVDTTERPATFVPQEHTEKGHVKSKVYQTYFAACGGWLFWIILVLAFVTGRALAFAENWWLRLWAAAYNRRSLKLGSGTGMENEVVNVNYYILIYVVLCMVYIVFDVVRNAVLFWGSLRGSKALFTRLLLRVIHAPMRFFDTTPIGRILNRFTSDIMVLDLQLARTSSLMLDCLTMVIASVVVISVVTPQFAIIAVCIGLAYGCIGAYYLRTSRELKRINAVQRSPIYSMFTEAVAGASTIRAFGQQNRFLLSMYKTLDQFLSPFYLMWMTNGWLLVRLDGLGALVTIAVCGLVLANPETMDAGLAGIALVYSRSFLAHIHWLVRQYTQLELNLNSVERIHEYLNMDQEPVGQQHPPAGWPTSGSLQVTGLHARYAPHQDDILNNVCFHARHAEKIGVVGRSGAGKSTLALALFRLLPHLGGSIVLDGVDIQQIDLSDLRSRLSMIPQEAELFAGTIRFNLDPFDTYDDTELWGALSRVKIAASLVKMAGTDQVHQVLQVQVTDGGSNFSQGQRQLLCLARALLRNSKLILLDEATASVDLDTDHDIQTVIREAFAESTVICIAHRLRTVIDYDRILVLEQGRVVEYDTPLALLTQTEKYSYFRALCEQSGDLEHFMAFHKSQIENIL